MHRAQFGRDPLLAVQHAAHQRSDADTGEEVDQPGVVGTDVDRQRHQQARGQRERGDDQATVVGRSHHPHQGDHQREQPAGVVVDDDDHGRAGERPQEERHRADVHAAGHQRPRHEPEHGREDGRAIERPVAAEDRHERGAHRGQRQHQRGRQLRRPVALAVVHHAGHHTWPLGAGHGTAGRCRPGPSSRRAGVAPARRPGNEPIAVRCRRPAAGRTIGTPPAAWRRCPPGGHDAHSTRPLHRSSAPAGVVVHRAVHAGRRRHRHARVRRARRRRVRGSLLGERPGRRRPRS